jgi:hypothetical protein
LTELFAGGVAQAPVGRAGQELDLDLHKWLDPDRLGRDRSSIAKIRRGLYWLADRLGDVEAVKQGRVRAHMHNRMGAGSCPG